MSYRRTEEGFYFMWWGANNKYSCMLWSITACEPCHFPLSYGIGTTSLWMTVEFLSHFCSILQTCVEVHCGMLLFVLLACRYNYALVTVQEIRMFIFLPQLFFCSSARVILLHFIWSIILLMLYFTRFYLCLFLVNCTVWVKPPPPRFSGIFSHMVGNFLTKFFMPLVSSSQH